jgi:hypothetical protein
MEAAAYYAVTCELVESAIVQHDDSLIGTGLKEEPLGVNFETIIEGLDTELDLKADLAYVDSQDALKADLTYVNTELNKKANKTYVDTELNIKANKTYVDTQNALKADQAYVDDEIDLKADKTDVDEELTKKADLIYVDNELELKADKEYVDNELETRDNTISSQGIDISALKQYKEQCEKSFSLQQIKPDVYTEFNYPRFHDGFQLPELIMVEKDFE